MEKGENWKKQEVRKSYKKKKNQAIRKNCNLEKIGNQKKSRKSEKVGKQERKLKKKTAQRIKKIKINQVMVWTFGLVYQTFLFFC